MKDLVTREIRYQIIDKNEFLEKYNPDELTQENCKGCPYYNNRWSCPPGIPDLGSYVEDYSKVCIIMLKVNYSEALIKTGRTSAKAADAVRDFYYENTKKTMLKALLKAESRISGSKLTGAGRCTLCKHCSREEGKPCRNPQLRRFSVTGFGLDFAKMLNDQFDVQLNWCKEGLSEYDVAVSALFLKE